MKTIEKGYKRAWVVMLIAALVSLSMSWAQAKIPPVIGEMMNYFSISMTTAGWLSSIVNIVGIAMALPAAGLIQKMGIKKAGIIALSFAISGGIIGLFAPNIIVIFLSRFIEGIGTGFVDVLIPIIIAMWFPAQKRGLPTSIWCSSLLVAQSASFVIADSLTPFWGWRSMWIFGLIMLVIAGLLYYWKVAEPATSFDEDDAKNSRVDILKVFRYRSVWLISGAVFLYCISCFGWSTWAATYWSESFHLNLNDANNIVGLIYMAEIVIAIFNGWLLNKIFKRKLFCILMSIAYGLLLLFAFRMTSNLAMLFFAILYPFLESAVCAGLWTIAPQTVDKPAFTGIALAIVVMGLDLGMVVGPPLTGFIVENFGWHAATINFFVSGFLCSLCVYFTKLHTSADDGK